MELQETIRSLYREFGPPKPMGQSPDLLNRPHFFLHRNFLGEQDLAILFSTKRCRYACKFCALPFKSSHEWIDGDAVLRQFLYVIDQLKHSLGVLDRLTIANEGSVFDEGTFPPEALLAIASSVRALPRLRKLVIETRLEYVRTERLREIAQASGKRLDVLTGFETHDPAIRDEILGKHEPLSSFLAGLDRVGEAGADLTAYVLFKPSYTMTDAEARTEAEASIDFVAAECRQRGIPLIIRLNAMYVARGTRWAKAASAAGGFQPPRLSDVLELAEKKRREGVRVYVGLTSEGLADEAQGTYRAREDFSSHLIKRGILLNNG